MRERRWADAKKILAKSSQANVFELVRRLFELSAENRAFILSSITAEPDKRAIKQLEKKLSRDLYPGGYNNPNFSSAKLLIKQYAKAHEPRGLAQLLLSALHTSLCFTHDQAAADMTQGFVYWCIGQLIKLGTSEEGRAAVGQVRKDFVGLRKMVNIGYAMDGEYEEFLAAMGWGRAAE